MPPVESPPAFPALRVRQQPRTSRVGRCPLCNAAAASEFTLRDRRLCVPGEFTYRRCHQCASVYQDPRVLAEDLGLCYPAEYYTHTAPPPPPPGRPFPHLRARMRSAVADAALGHPRAGFAGQVAAYLARDQRVRNRALCIDVVEELNGRPSGEKRALDIGCGSGDLLLALTAAGWDASGVEWDPQAAEVARKRTRCSISVGNFRDLALPAGAYDLVVLKHVLEHLDDPVAALREISRLLAPGARAVLIYPNTRSIGARLFGEYWRDWDPPRHLVFPSPEALATAALQASLTPVRIRTRAHHTASILAHSRALREGSPDPDGGPSWRDRVLGRVAAVLARFGFSVGEELVVVLTKDS